MTPSLHDKTLSHLSSIRFHRSFTLPANPQHGRPSPMRVTYADCDYSTSPDGPVLLLIGGMMGGRYVSAGTNDALARHHKVRLVCVDKPGMGGTGSVDLKLRIQTWLDIVPSLLSHLSIPHVAIVSHSNGAIYAFNTLLTHRSILHPRHPYIAFLAPWSHPSHSSTNKALSYVPNALFSAWPSVLKAIVTTSVAPPVAFSTGIAKMVFSSSSDKEEEEKRPADVDEEAWAIKPLVWDLLPVYIFKEDTQGSAQEAQLCLKKGFSQGSDNHPWALFEDYDQAVNMVVAQEASLPSPFPSRPQRPEKLKVRAFYAESDGLVGKGGAEWMDKCWQETEGVDEWVDFSSETVPGTNHDGIGDAQKGIVSRIMRDVFLSFGE